MTLLEMSVSASLIILAIVVIRSLAIHALPKIMFVILWGIAICRLFIPFSVSSPFSPGEYDQLNHFIPGFSSRAIPALQTDTAIRQMINSTGKASLTTFINPVLIAWGIGLVACALFFLIPLFRSRREYRTALPIDNPFIAGWLKSHKAWRSIQVRQFDRISAPLTYEIFHPVILLPKRMDWNDEKQLEFVLTHEFIHIKRFDTAWKWLLAASLCIHWFNPLVWAMYMLANRDIELSCDEAVVRTLGEAQKSSYALTLINLEERRSIQTLLFNNFSRNAIKERISAIMKQKNASLVGNTIAMFLVVSLTVACAMTGPISINPSGQGNVQPQVATPVPQSSAPRAGVSTSANGSSLNAMPVASNPISASEISSLINNKKDILEAKDLIQSTSPRDGSKANPHSSIVIKFKQAMDARTLDYPNILVYSEKSSSVVDYLFNFNYNEATRELHLDMKRDIGETGLGSVGTGNMIHVILTSKIKTADGKLTNQVYVFSYRT